MFFKSLLFCSYGKKYFCNYFIFPNWLLNRLSNISFILTHMFLCVAKPVLCEKKVNIYLVSIKLYVEM